MRLRETFQRILVAVAPHNIQTLENVARTASSLATTYRKNEAVFRSLESEALQQIFRIMTDMDNGQDASRLVDKRPDREPAPVRLLVD